MADYLFCLYGRPATLERVREVLCPPTALAPCPPMTEFKAWMVSRTPKPGDRAWVIWIGRNPRTGIGAKGELLGAGVLEASPSADEYVAVIWTKKDCDAQGIPVPDGIGTTFLRLGQFVVPGSDVSEIEVGQYQGGFNTPTDLDHHRLYGLLALP